MTVFFSISDSENCNTHRSNYTYPITKVTELSQLMTELSLNHLLYNHTRHKQFSLSDTETSCDTDAQQIPVCSDS
jgi:hypothetical protein